MLSKSKNYKSLFTKQQRVEESSRMLKKYPSRRPIICDRSSHHNKDIPTLDKRKYLVPDDLTASQLIYVIKKRLKLAPELAIFIFCGDGKLVNSSHTMRYIYENYKDKDGFVYIVYSGESTFG